MFFFDTIPFCMALAMFSSCLSIFFSLSNVHGWIVLYALILRFEKFLRYKLYRSRAIQLIYDCVDDNIFEILFAHLTFRATVVIFLFAGAFIISVCFAGICKNRGQYILFWLFNKSSDLLFQKIRCGHHHYRTSKCYINYGKLLRRRRMQVFKSSSTTHYSQTKKQ